MIIKTFELEKIKNSKKNLFLFYGENEGFKNEIINNIFLSSFNGRIERFEEYEVLNNLEDFLSTLINKSFFEDTRLILISRTGEKIIKLINEIVDRNIDDVKIIINAGVLDKRSKLRTEFEKNKNLVCVPFYKDDNRSLNQIANNFFKKKQIPISQEIINLIIERSSGDRINLNNELNKISLFLVNNEKITIDNIMKLTNLAENYSISELADNCLSKNVKKINKIFNENIFSVEDCILIVRTLLIKSKRLLELKKIYNSNNNIEEIIRNYKPPIFWKDKEIVKNQISKWNLEETENLVYKISDLEMDVKKNYYNSLNIVSDFVLNTAK